MANAIPPSENMDQAFDVLHQRMLSGDVTAFAEIAEACLPTLTGRLTKKIPNLDDPNLVDSAVVDALMSYQKNPSQFDPNKLRLDQYLYMSARGDLLNLLEKHKKDKVLLSLTEIVELYDENSEYGVEVPSDANVEEQVLEKLSPTWHNLRKLLPDPLDQAMLLLMMDGIRETNLFAEALNITDLPAKDQASIVKRHKDRIKKMILRHIDPSELGI